MRFGRFVAAGAVLGLAIAGASLFRDDEGDRGSEASSSDAVVLGFAESLQTTPGMSEALASPGTPAAPAGEDEGDDAGGRPDSGRLAFGEFWSRLAREPEQGLAPDELKLLVERRHAVGDDLRRAVDEEAASELSRADAISVLGRLAREPDLRPAVLHAITGAISRAQASGRADPETERMIAILKDLELDPESVSVFLAGSADPAGQLDAGR
jgi:hypothetical protein